MQINVSFIICGSLSSLLDLVCSLKAVESVITKGAGKFQKVIHCIKNKQNNKTATKGHKNNKGSVNFKMKLM